MIGSRSSSNISPPPPNADNSGNSSSSDDEETETTFWTCKSRIVGITMPPHIGPQTFIIGQPAFHRYYTAFSYVGPSMGFGLAAARSAEDTDAEFAAAAERGAHEEEEQVQALAAMRKANAAHFAREEAATAAAKAAAAAAAATADHAGAGDADMPLGSPEGVEPVAGPNLTEQDSAAAPEPAAVVELV